MKNFTPTLLLFIISLVGHSQQTFTIKTGGLEIKTTDITGNDTFRSEIKTFEIKKEPADAAPKKYTISNSGATQTFLTDGAYHSVTFPADVRDSSTAIASDQGAVIGAPFILKSSAPDTGNPDTGNNTRSSGTKLIMPKDKSASQYLTNTLFKDQIDYFKNIGLKIKKGAANSKYTGDDYVHLFFDQNANSLLRSIPIGIGKGNYVVHVVYLVPEDNPLNIQYNVNQISAYIDEGITIRGDGDLSGNAITLAGKEGEKAVELKWQHFEIMLTPSSYDVVFDITRSGLLLTDGVVESPDTKIIATRMIRMKKIYHGSIDVGVIKSNLENPTYTLTASATDATQMVVKKSDQGSRVIASAMYTFYLSPVILLEKLLNPTKVRNYQIEGRSFVDDHRIYERIYPTVGIGLSNRLLDNVFLGGKWEFIRGGSLFAGYHWGKVNVLDVEENFEFGTATMTQATFDLKKDIEWDGSFCAGLNLDLRIITNLFRTGTNPAK